MSSASERRRINSEAEAERNRREEERRLFKEAQELENLRRAFKRIDKSTKGRIDASDVMAELNFLNHPVKADEAGLIIWEVDDDADDAVDWEEFRTMFYRIRDDASGCEPRKLFNLVEFIMYDKNSVGSIDLDECLVQLYSRYGRENLEKCVKELCGNEKNVNFTIYATLNKRGTKASLGGGMKPGAKMVPVVKGLPAMDMI